ncbi:MAG TPA: class I SAM-dependent methyltransferase [Xenococcaceae cyanobacterium]|jgi:2-polyprenyl-3-methyl-5-hydroxy-6-metoxy-1,4-benzoquinol methylase
MNHNQNFSNHEAQAAWNRGADAWNHFVESKADYYRIEVHAPALLAACEPVENLKVLDLGCGQGFFCRTLAKSGAIVVGVDIAEKQIEWASLHEQQQPLGIEYQTIAAEEVSKHWSSQSFDLVTACMSLQDMADVGSSLQAAFMVLRSGGRMVFSVPHPGTDTPLRQWELDESGKKVALKIDRYFESGSTVCQWKMHRLKYHWQTPYWRYTLSQWSSLIEKAGFTIRRLHEPRPTLEQVQNKPELEDCYRLPYFLIFDLVKLS